MSSEDSKSVREDPLVGQKINNKRRLNFLLKLSFSLLFAVSLLSYGLWNFIIINHEGELINDDYDSLKPTRTLVKRGSTTDVLSLNSVPASCPLTPRAGENARSLAPKPNKIGSPEYLAKVMDPTQARSRLIHEKYYDWNLLNEFKQSQWYTSHINNVLAAKSAQIQSTYQNTSGLIIQLNSPAGNLSTSQDNYYRAYIDSKYSNTNHTYGISNNTVYVGNQNVPPNVTAVEYLTGGRQLVQIHSHNDYTRDTPLFDALQRGYKSIEADIWYFPGKSCDYNLASLKEFALSSDSNFSDCDEEIAPLYVSHKRGEITNRNTLKSMYLDYIESFLDEINDFYGIARDAPPTEKAGIFFNDPFESLNILLDFKNSGFPTYKLVMRTIEQLIAKNYVSYYDFESDQRVSGPLTFILSGDAPADVLFIEDKYRLEAKTGKRYVYMDSQLQDLTTNTTTMDFARLGAYASAEFEKGLKYDRDDWSSYYKHHKFLVENGTLDFGIVNATKPKFDLAHSLKLSTRLWGAPSYQDEVASEINIGLIKQCGLDMLNVDDLDLGMEIWKKSNTNTNSFTDYGVNRQISSVQ